VPSTILTSSSRCGDDPVRLGGRVGRLGIGVYTAVCSPTTRSDKARRSTDNANGSDCRG
jgi:hypothetical protein